MNTRSVAMERQTYPNKGHRKACTRGMARLLGGLSIAAGLLAGTALQAAVYPMSDVTCPTSLGSCTANEVKTRTIFAEPITTNGNGTCSGPDDTIEVALTIQVYDVNSDRFDFAILVAKDGASLNGTPAGQPAATNCMGEIGIIGDTFDDLDAETFVGTCDYADLPYNGNLPTDLTDPDPDFPPCGECCHSFITAYW